MSEEKKEDPGFVIVVVTSQNAWGTGHTLKEAMDNANLNLLYGYGYGNGDVQFSVCVYGCKCEEISVSYMDGAVTYPSSAPCFNLGVFMCKDFIQEDDVIMAFEGIVDTRLPQARRTHDVISKLLDTVWAEQEQERLKKEEEEKSDVQHDG